MSKTIAIISELNASVDPKMKDESTIFLRGLYTAIIAELPKVSLNNNFEILDRTEAYIIKLKEIWENDVMGKPIESTHKPMVKPVKKGKHPAAIPGYGSTGNVKRFNSISV